MINYISDFINIRTKVINYEELLSSRDITIKKLEDDLDKCECSLEIANLVVDGLRKEQKRSDTRMDLLNMAYIQLLKENKQLRKENRIIIGLFVALYSVSYLAFVLVN